MEHCTNSGHWRKIFDSAGLSPFTKALAPEDTILCLPLSSLAPAMALFPQCLAQPWFNITRSYFCLQTSATCAYLRIACYRIIFYPFVTKFCIALLGENGHLNLTIALSCLNDNHNHNYCFSYWFYKLPTPRENSCLIPARFISIPFRFFWLNCTFSLSRHTVTTFPFFLSLPATQR